MFNFIVHIIFVINNMYIIYKFSDYFKYLWFYVFELQHNKKIIIFYKLAFIFTRSYILFLKLFIKY